MCKSRFFVSLIVCFSIILSSFRKALTQFWLISLSQAHQRKYAAIENDIQFNISMRPCEKSPFVVSVCVCCAVQYLFCFLMMKSIHTFALAHTHTPKECKISVINSFARNKPIEIHVNVTYFL